MREGKSIYSTVGNPIDKILACCKNVPENLSNEFTLSFQGKNNENISSKKDYYINTCESIKNSCKDNVDFHRCRFNHIFLSGSETEINNETENKRFKAQGQSKEELMKILTEAEDKAKEIIVNAKNQRFLHMQKARKYVEEESKICRENMQNYLAKREKEIEAELSRYEEIQNKEVVEEITKITNISKKNLNYAVIYVVEKVIDIDLSVSEEVMKEFGLNKLLLKVFDKVHGTDNACTYDSSMLDLTQDELIVKSNGIGNIKNESKDAKSINENNNNVLLCKESTTSCAHLQGSFLLKQKTMNLKNAQNLEAKRLNCSEGVIERRKIDILKNAAKNENECAAAGNFLRNWSSSNSSNNVLKTEKDQDAEKKDCNKKEKNKTKKRSQFSAFKKLYAKILF